MSADTDRVEARLSAVETSIDSLGGRVDRLDNRIETRFDRLDGRITDVNQNLDSRIDDRFDDLDGKINDVDEKSTLNHALSGKTCTGPYTGSLPP